MAKRKDSRTARKGEHPSNGERVRAAVAWAVEQQIFAQVKLHGNTTWKIVELIVRTMRSAKALPDKRGHQLPKRRSDVLPDRTCDLH